MSPGNHIEKAAAKQDVISDSNTWNDAGWNDPLPGIPAPRFEVHKRVKRHDVLKNIRPLINYHCIPLNLVYQLTTLHSQRIS